MSFAFNPIRPRSLRGQLIGLVAALAIPLVALQVWWGYRESQRAVDAAAAQALAHADATALILRQFLAQAEAGLTNASAGLGMEFVTGTPCNNSMQTLANIILFVSSVTTVDRDGNLLCSVDPIPEGASATDWAWFRPMADNPQYFVGDPLVGELSGTWVLPLVAPILDEQGRFMGAIAGAAALSGFAQRMSGDLQDEDVLVTIANAEHVVVARSHNAEQWVGRPLPPRRGTDEPVTPGRSVARGPDFEDIDRAWGQVELENGWWVYVGVPAETVFGPARAAAARQISATLLILLVGMLLAGLSYRRISSALRELASGMPMTEGGGAVHVPEGTPTEFLAVVQQFDETLQSRNRAEESERATRERYQSIFDNAVFGMSLATLDGRFLEVNAALVSMLGYESASALMEAGAASLYSSPGLRARLVDEALQTHMVENWEVDWVRADGLRVSVRLNGKIIRMADGEPAFEMIVQDITDERHKENELRQKQKMEAIGQLAGGIAHDFNNLLTVIGGNSELIEDGLPADEPLRAELAQVMEATERAASLTAQLLAFSRKEPRATRPVPVNEVITDMERMLARLIGDDVTLEARLAPDLPYISIDPGELEQIIMNLVLNARDAMPMGGRIAIETRSAPADSESQSAPVDVDGVSLSVRDTGLGMDVEMHKRIFEPFFTTKPIGEGTGLGLSTVYGIVQRAEGRIDVESEPGEGTTISIWFPPASAEAGRGRQAEEAASPARGNEKILVVEDEELVRLFVHRALEQAGYEILEACDGHEALEIVGRLDSPVDLVLTDIVMPRMKGPELAERLSAVSPETAVLFMCGYIDNEVVEEQFKDRPEALLRKPFTRAELCERVRATLDVGDAPHVSV